MVYSNQPGLFYHEEEERRKRVYNTYYIIGKGSVRFRLFDGHNICMYLESFPYLSNTSVVVCSSLIQPLSGPVPPDT